MFGGSEFGGVVSKPLLPTVIPTLDAYCCRLHQRLNNSRFPPDISRVIGM